MTYTGVGATVKHARIILDSYKKWTGKNLLDGVDGFCDEFDRLFHAPFAVLSHGTEADPVLNFGNQTVLKLWEMDWETFTRTPSRMTAEPMLREERDRLLKEVSEKGFVEPFTGIRISSTGRRFYIVNATVWNLVDEFGAFCGQAAAFREHRYV
ncbi:MEKHLA domain-containing protein [Cohnella sp. CFH 77786]|uniref:MEKHLA domain-containing protein n=1 Tax=Cohnella sp. CFH 77786 TaxID=2662265 RepID=UPI001C60B4DB|nr:MEKHLA domain-containing protein [Cohnella sp. CFH 77786]